MMDDRILLVFKPLLLDRPLNSPRPCYARVQCYDKRYLLYAGQKILSRGNGVDHKVFIVHS